MNQHPLHFIRQKSEFYILFWSNTFSQEYFINPIWIKKGQQLKERTCGCRQFTKSKLPNSAQSMFIISHAGLLRMDFRCILFVKGNELVKRELPLRNESTNLS